MQAVDTKITAKDEKQKAILGAAFDAFSQYGFRRTSMEDIARGAGMSRAALYLHYRNKEDIFRSLSSVYYDDVIERVGAVLSDGGAPKDVLLRAFGEQTGGEAMRAFLESPHGQELVDTKHAVAADINQAGEARLAAVYAAWLSDAVAAGRINPAALGGEAAEFAHGFAQTMMAALHGQKFSSPDFDSYQQSVGRLARAFGIALQAR